MALQVGRGAGLECMYRSRRYMGETNKQSKRVQQSTVPPHPSNQALFVLLPKLGRWRNITAAAAAAAMERHIQK